MENIKLENEEWTYDPNKQLGPAGGFGAVYKGSGKGYDSVAVKKLNIRIDQAQHRELKIAKELKGRKLDNVIPIIDSGQDANSDFYFVVMPIAEKSLRDEVKKLRSMDDVGAALVLMDIAKGLSEVPEIVHRDLKPGNVLFHDGRWKVADFGIARFVEDSTSLRTVRHFRTPEYAAPEQWQIQGCSQATDIYALACIGYFLITGHPPFQGSDESLKQQHLRESPPCLEGHSPRLHSLLLMMLRKTPEVRPTLNRVIDILGVIQKEDTSQPSGQGKVALAEAGAEIVSLEAKREALQKAHEEEIVKRFQIGNEAYELFKDLVKKLFLRIVEATPVAEVDFFVPKQPLKSEIEQILSRGGECCVRLGTARLLIEYLNQKNSPFSLDMWSRSQWDVVHGAIIKIRQLIPKYEWSASLWYSKLPDDDNYRWREVSYFGSPLIPKKKLDIEYEPFALRNINAAVEAVLPIMDIYQIAFGPKPIDDEDFETFCDRWSDLLAKAAKGQLCHPRQLPLE